MFGAVPVCGYWSSDDRMSAPGRHDSDEPITAGICPFMGVKRSFRLRAQNDANDPFETCAAQGFRSAKALFVPWLNRDIVPTVACTRPPAGGVAWQSTSDGENSYSHWARRRRGPLRRVGSNAT